MSKRRPVQPPLFDTAPATPRPRRTPVERAPKPVVSARGRDLLGNPPDQHARDRIASELARNLFVEAGAGSGKTASLVGRIVALVAAGSAIDSIAAITFTEKAAAELRHRVREELERAAADAPDASAAEPFERALDRLDHAPIGTLHAFARRLLGEFPIEAGLPPGFTVLDEMESDLAFEERWEDLLDHLLSEADPTGGAIAGGSRLVELCKFRGFGIARGVRRVAIGFHDNWDLVLERVDQEPPPAWSPDVGPVMAAIDLLAAAHDCPADDKQAEHVGAVSDAGAHLRRAQALLATLDALDHVAACAKPGVKGGSKAKWKHHGGDASLEAVRDGHRAVRSAADAVARQAIDHRKRLVGAILARWVAESARARAADGALEFHDLLVLARQLLTTSASARRVLHRRYTHLLLDEFQDTDPIQLAIAMRLTADPDDPAQLPGADWTALRPLPGRLFIVGDPKQSIYRFRRADIAQYLRAADQLGATPERLSANFRSSATVIDWVNSVFSSAITFAADAQPHYQALDVCRPAHTEHGTVSVLGVTSHDDLDGRGSADELRAREAADVAAAVATALDAAWPVGDKDAGNQPMLRPCRPGDITILLPARTSLPALEAALRSTGIPYRAENATIAYLTTEIRHVMLALRAADDTSDELALVAALRTPLYGCSDVELFEWHSGGGRWSIWAPAPDGLAEHRVAQAFDHLRSVARRSTTVGPADLVAAIVDERRMLDAALDDADARDVWRRVRYVVEQARAWSDAGGHGVRRYLSWVRHQASEARSADTILPEHDHDAVRIMTVHAAKGLEFPVTFVSGLSTRPRRSGGDSVVWPPGTWAIAHRDDDVFDEFQPVDETMSDAERRRLLYVACTRAVDHLVVSLHRLQRDVTDEAKMTSAELLFRCGAAGAGATPLSTSGAPFSALAPAVAELEWADHTQWAAERVRALEHATRRLVVGATTLAAASSATGAIDIDPGLDKDPVDLDLPPWQRGRYGTAVGRAVHAVLQFADLRHGTDIAAHAAAQCSAEGILGMDDLVAALARSALAAPIVRTATDAEHHRELFIAAAIGADPASAVVVEGYIDLLVRTDEGLVVVDYKTDQWPDDTERADRIERYSRQLAVYAAAVEQITGELPVRGVLVRCRPDGPAEEIDISDWAAALVTSRTYASAAEQPTEQAPHSEAQRRQAEHDREGDR